MYVQHVQYGNLVGESALFVAATHNQELLLSTTITML